MKRYFLLALTAVPVVLAFGTGCKKTVPTVEAGTDIPVAAVEDAAVAPVADLDAAAPLATVAHTATAVKSAAPAVGVFQGTYSCFNGMSVSQTGNTVIARQNIGKTDNWTQLACTAAGDTCDGMSTIYVAGRVSGTKHAVMTHKASGDLTYKGDGEAATLCHKK